MFEPLETVGVIMNKLIMVGVSAGFAMACFAAQPASAQVRSTVNTTASVPVSTRTAAQDPNRQVCVSEDVIGSRLGSKRVCRTAAEWVAYRREARNTVDRVQALKVWNQDTDLHLRQLTNNAAR